MTQEEKAKAYDEAKARMSKAYNSNRCTIGFMNEIFPEFKDEDERIKEEIINYFECQSRDEPCRKSIHDKWIAWIEKQGQTFTKEDTDNANKVEPKDYNSIDPHFGKPADKVEPKFQNGQWIVWQDKCYKVNYNGCGYELIDQNGLSTSLEYGTIDENAHLWDITKDAKDGDVLCYKDEISLYKHDIKNCTKQGTTFGGFVYHCCYDGKRFIVDSFYSLTEQDKMDIHPATKEQCDTLEKAMANAGYTFDFEKEELKKIEQKPSWSEEDSPYYDDICEILRNLILIETDKINKDFVQKDLDWLKSLKDRYSWKPSEKQMKALKEACDEHWEPDGLDPLYTLYQDLKKLREE